MTTNQRALVTGGNRSIGFAIAQGLINGNYEVIITARSNSDFFLGESTTLRGCACAFEISPRDLSLEMSP